MAKMKNNKDGGGVNASDPKAAGKSIEKIEKGAAKYKGSADGHKMDEKKGAAKYKGSADGHMKGEKKEGAAKYKGAHDYDTSKGSHSHDSKGGHGAARMGYSQSFGAARMNGYAKGAARVANIMSFGASKYMKHGAADGHTVKDILESRKARANSSSIDPVDGDVVPNYNTTNTTVRPNTSPSSSSSSSSSSKPSRTREQAFQNRGSEFQNMNRSQYNAEIDKYNASKAVNTSSSSDSPSSSVSSTTTNTKIGNLTPNSVALSGEEQLQNNKNKIKAEYQARVLARKKDSTDAANKYLARKGRQSGTLTELDALEAQKVGNRAALSSGLSANRDMGYPRSRQSIFKIIEEISAKPNIDMD